MSDLIIKPSGTSANFKVQNPSGNNKITMDSDGVTTFASNVALSGTVTTGTLASGVTFPSGHIIKTTAAIHSGTTVDVTNNTITSVVNVDYTCVSSSNKILLMGIGVVSRATQNGQTSFYYYKDTTLLQDYQSRIHYDGDDFPIGNWYLDGHSGSANFSLRIQSMSNDSKVEFKAGSGFLLMEIQA